jgi:hypothetical protein
MVACDEFQALRLDVRFIFGLMPGEAGQRFPYNYLKTSDFRPARRQNLRAVFLLPNFGGRRALKHISCVKGVTRMGRQIRVRAIKKEEPDLRLYVLALIALARQLAEEEQRDATTARAVELERRQS